MRQHFCTFAFGISRCQARGMRLLLAFAAVFLGAAAKTEKSSAREGLLAALKGRIKHVVVLMEENRSFDHVSL